MTQILWISKSQRDLINSINLFLQQSHQETTINFHQLSPLNNKRSICDSTDKTSLIWNIPLVLFSPLFQLCQNTQWGSSASLSPYNFQWWSGHCRNQKHLSCQSLPHFKTHKKKKQSLRYSSSLVHNQVIHELLTSSVNFLKTPSHHTHGLIIKNISVIYEELSI